MCILLFNYKKVREQLKRTRNMKGMLIIIPAFLAALVIACISSPSVRYIYNLLPFYVLLVGNLMFVLKNLDVTYWRQFTKRVSKCFLPALFCVGILMLFVMKPDFLYKEHKQYNRLIKPYANCVYISDNINSCITSDLCQLLNFNEIYVSDSSNIHNKYKDICYYIDPFNEVVIYIAKYNNPYSSDEITNVLLNSIRNSEVIKLYDGDFSSAYLLKKKQ